MDNSLKPISQLQNPESNVQVAQSLANPTTELPNSGSPSENLGPASFFENSKSKGSTHLSQPLPLFFPPAQSPAYYPWNVAAPITKGTNSSGH